MSLLDLLRTKTIEKMPAQEIYDEMLRYHHVLAELYGKTGTLPPALLLERAKSPLFEILPANASVPENFDPTYLENKDIHFSDASAEYFLEHHILYLKTQDISVEELPPTIVHEITHAVKPLNHPIVTIEALELCQFNGFEHEYGTRFHQAFTDVSARMGGEGKPLTLELALPEFFVPFSEAHIFGKTQDMPWREEVEKAINPGWFSSDYRTLGRLINLAEHLPQLAGELMIKQYGNTHEITKAHPGLWRLDGRKVWSDYVRPLLVSGKLA